MNRAIALPLIMLALLFMVSVYQHEAVHVLINNQFGVESHMGLTWYGAYTRPDVEDIRTLSPDLQLARVSLHQANEIYTYNSLPWHVAITFFLMVIAFVLMDIKQQLVIQNGKKIVSKETG